MGCPENSVLLISDKSRDRRRSQSLVERVDFQSDRLESGTTIRTWAAMKWMSPTLLP